VRSSVIATRSILSSNLTYREVRYFSEVARVTGYQCAAGKHRGSGDNAVGDFDRAANRAMRESKGMMDSVASKSSISDSSSLLRLVNAKSSTSVTAET